MGNSYNQYFNYTNNTMFYVLSTPYLYQFYLNEVRLWDEWCTGWVQGFHNAKKGLLPTQLAGSLCHKLADLIYGDGILFESTKDKNVQNDALDFLGAVDEQIDIKASFKDSILKSCQLGNGYIKTNVDKFNEVWLDTIAGNRAFVDLDSRGKVVRARCYINLYTGGIKGKGGKQDTYAITEERFYQTDEDGALVKRNGRLQPMIEYKAYKITAPSGQFQASSQTMAFGDLPRQVREAFRNDYGDLKIGDPQPFDYPSLGIYHVKHTDYITGSPNIKLGESCLARIINYLPKYDAIDSEETIDLRVSRPKIVVPSFMNKAKGDSLENYDDVILQKVENKSDKEQLPSSFIPTPREEHFIRLKEDVIKKICGNIGVATSSIFSDIADARGNVTAREIDSETSNTALYVSNKRKKTYAPFNECLRDILEFYGYDTDVKVTYTPAGSSNKTVMVENTAKLNQAGLQSKYQSIKELHPDWTDTQIDAELELIDNNAKAGYTGAEVKDQTTQTTDSRNSGKKIDQTSPA